MAVRGFHEGDVVRVREWDDLAAEWEADEDGDLLIGHCYFFKEMRPMCGKISTVKQRIIVSPSCYTLILDDALDDGELFEWQQFPPETLEYCENFHNAELVCEISSAELSGILSHG